ncbi:MAG: YdeI/OmpD-associated family protein [Thermomicrobiales bacterium]
MTDEEEKDGIPVVFAATIHEWRDWLDREGPSAQAVWLVLFHTSSSRPSIRYAESIEQCLCFGWVDSKSIRRDEESAYLRFTPRKRTSTWSKVNRQRVQEMTEKGLMTPRGQAMIDYAKENNLWEVLTDAESDQIPEDLQLLFDRNPMALQHFEVFPPSSRRLILEWIAKAKRPDTRQRRIEQTVELAEQNVRAAHPGR